MAARWLFVLVVAFLLVARAPYGLARIGIAASDETAKCVALQSRRWRPQEAWAWRQLCSGREADLALAGDVVLTPGFLRDVLAVNVYRDALPFGTILIRHARFVDPVDLNDATLTRNIQLDDCTFDSDVNLERVSATAPISLNRGSVAGHLALSDFHGTSVFLLGLTVVGDIDAHDMNLSGNFRAYFPAHPSNHSHLFLARVRVTGYLRVDGELAELSAENAHSANFFLEKLTLRAGAYLENMTVSESFQVEGSTFAKRPDKPGASYADLTDKCYQAPRSIDADNASFGSVLLAGDRLQGITLNRSTVGGHLVVHSSRTGFTCMRDLLVNGVFEMTALRGASEIYLDNSTIERNVYVTNSSFKKLTFDVDRIGGSLFLSGWQGQGEVSAQNADIGGGLTIKDSPGPTRLRTTFLRSILLNGITVADAVFFRNVVLCEVPALSARPGCPVTVEKLNDKNDLEMTASAQDGALILSDARLHSTVALESLHAKKLQMNSAAIDGDLKLADVAASEVDLGGARVARTLYLQQRHKHEAIGELNLRDTNVQTVEDRAPCDEQGAQCPIPWPAKMELDGFHFEQLGSSRIHDLALGDPVSRPSDWWEEHWLRAQQPYAPEPYDTLASVMHAAGQDDTANQIAWTRRDQDRMNSRPEKQLLLTLWDAVAGYGYAPLYALGWALFFLLLGAFLLWRTGEGAKHTPRLDWTYSFDMLVPLIFLEKKHEEVRLFGRVRYYFYFHKIVGYVLATLLVAGLSGLVK